MKNLNSIDLHGMTFSITGYPGHENEILQFRNANRDSSKTREYLDWRYKERKGCPAAKIFWLRNDSGQAVGMAAVIFRRYNINGRPTIFSVLGDISLSEKLRGKGVGCELLRTVTHYIQVHAQDCPGFVIPTTAAMKTLDRIGWEVAERLVPYVCLIDWSDRLSRAIKNRWIVDKISGGFNNFFRLIRRNKSKAGFRLVVTDSLDDSFEFYWERYAKSGLMLIDRSLDSLSYRYSDHPAKSFRFGKLLYNELFVGYLIFELCTEEKICQIYDIMINNPCTELPMMLALLVDYCETLKCVNSIRFVVNERYRYTRKLWTSGFFARTSQNVFQVYWPSGFQSTGNKWFISLGDKDI